MSSLFCIPVCVSMSLLLQAPSEEKTAQVVDSFIQRYDANNNGTLEVNEWRGLRQAKEMDADANGTLTEEEIVKGLPRTTRSGELRADGTPASDKSGSAEAKEFTPILLPAGEARILEELARHTTPLADALDLLETYHKIPIEIDRKALADEGHDPTQMIVNRSVKDIPLRSGLRLLLKDLDLIYVIVDDVVEVTTPGEAQTNLTTRVYPVRDIIAAVGEGGIEQLTQAVASICREHGEVAEAATTSGSMSSAAAATGGGFGMAPSVIPVHVVSGALIVTQSWPNHERVIHLLQDLRQLPAAELRRLEGIYAPSYLPSPLGPGVPSPGRPGSTDPFAPDARVPTPAVRP